MARKPFRSEPEATVFSYYSQHICFLELCNKGSTCAALESIEEEEEEEEEEAYFALHSRHS